MFHLEVSGPAKISGTLILPPGDKTYLVHCDIAQHMEKGMKAQLKVGKGDGDLPSIPNVTANIVQDDYKITLSELLAKAHEEANLPEPVVFEPVLAAVKPPVVIKEDSSFSGVTVIGLALGILIAPALARKFKGMTVTEIIAYLFELNRNFIRLASETVQRLLKMIQK
jgi:hypothetical protein